MPDLLTTSLTGMLAFQRALEVTGHNIANANTPGYSRQVATFGTRLGSGADNVYIGGGTRITSIKRVYDGMLVEQLRASTTGQFRFGILDQLAGRMDSLLADADTGLNTGLQSFFNGVQDLGNDPSSIPIRQALLGEADGLAGRFTSLDGRLDELDSEVNGRLKQAVSDINRLADAIADVNDRIALAGPAAQPNDLLDQRDQLVLELSGLVSVTSTRQDDGSLNVFIGSGQPLVVGTDVQRLGIRGGEFDPTRATIVYEGASGATPLDTSLTGGTLGGLLEFRSRMLDPARQSLGQTAIAFVNRFNEQHAAGMDLRGNLGGDFFGIAPPTVLTSSTNAGSGNATATISDLGALTGADYVLQYDGAAYSLVRPDTGAAVPMTGSGTAGDPFVADGMEIVTSGAPAAGDRLLIRSGADAAASIETLITDPQAIAMAAPTRVSAGIDNIGNASVTSTSIADATNPDLLTGAVIEFTSPTAYTIDGAGSFTYTEGDPIVINGTEITISGVPAAGDRFTIEPNYGAVGDNSNGLLLADIQSLGLLEGGSISINQNYAQLVSSVGSTTRQIQASLDAQNVVQANAENAVASTSGVNLDEEAAKLIRYQQSYQAVAQVVSVASTLFDSLLNATSR